MGEGVPQRHGVTAFLRLWYSAMCTTACVALPLMFATDFVGPPALRGFGGYALACAIASAAWHLGIAGERGDRRADYRLVIAGALIGAAFAVFTQGPPPPYPGGVAVLLVTLGVLLMMLASVAVGMVNWTAIGIRESLKRGPRWQYLLSVVLVLSAILAPTFTDESTAEELVGLLSTFMGYWGLASLLSAGLVFLSGSTVDRA